MTDVLQLFWNILFTVMIFEWNFFGLESSFWNNYILFYFQPYVHVKCFSWGLLNNVIDFFYHGVINCHIELGQKSMAQKKLTKYEKSFIAIEARRCDKSLKKHINLDEFKEKIKNMVETKKKLHRKKPLAPMKCSYFACTIIESKKRFKVLFSSITRKL